MSKKELFEIQVGSYDVDINYKFPKLVLKMHGHISFMGMWFFFIGLSEKNILPLCVVLSQC